MFGMRNFRCRYTENIIPILSVYRFSFDNYKGKFFNGNLKELLSNSKRENDNFEAVSNDTYSDSVKSHEVEILNHCSRKLFELPFSSKIKVMVLPYSW
jgi:hypothetical protein